MIYTKEHIIKHFQSGIKDQKNLKLELSMKVFVR